MNSGSGDAPGSIFGPLGNPVFRRLWGAMVFAHLGSLVQTVAAGWAMVQITDQHSMVALVQTSAAAPIMLFSVLAGVLADNMDRRRVLLVAQVIMMVAAGLLAVLAALGMLQPWTLLTFTFLIGCGSALHNPSWQAAVGDIVPRDDLTAAVSLNSLGFNLMRSIGPAIGGLVVSLFGAIAAFALNAVSYIPLILGLLSWRRETPPASLPRESFASAMRAGLRYTSLSPRILNLMLRSWLFGLCGIGVTALLPLIAADVVDAGALGFGTLLGAFGLGAIGGALNNQRLRLHFGIETIVCGATLVFAVASVVLGLSHNAVVSHLAMLPAGAAWVVALSLFNVTVQRSSPRWVVGRTLAFYQTAHFAGTAMGSWACGLLADAVGPGPALVGAGIAMACTCLIGLRRPLEEADETQVTPAGDFPVPAVGLDILPRSGPLTITSDFLIDDADLPRFMEMMSERRRIRLRYGASNWMLLRDLENPRQWSESFHVATWADYLRLRQRFTGFDRTNFAELRKLHRGEGMPVVHRKLERQPVQGDDI